MGLQLKTVPFEFDGKVFQLCCNMNVLADVQERFGGDLKAMLSANTTLTCITAFLTAMLNDYADSQGWPERYTAAQVGRQLDPTPAVMQKRNSMVLDLIYSAIVPQTASADQKKTEIPKVTEKPARSILQGIFSSGSGTK